MVYGVIVLRAARFNELDHLMALVVGLSILDRSFTVILSENGAGRNSDVYRRFRLHADVRTRTASWTTP
ncbi:hypothetical protein [Arthrobacter dokdonensis]|uniref:hypothetical protein n=1 Tax=Arthrobacter dokdonellae TaxID=2211210 RepID=UPI000DE58C0A|nr:hypothetical protein [Arthrobacter dokdonellae]